MRRQTIARDLRAGLCHAVGFDDRHAERRTDAENLPNLLLGFRQRHDHRQLLIGRESIAFVGPGVFFFEENCALRQEGAQGARYFVLPVER